jgi:hypothetical protein
MLSFPLWLSGSLALWLSGSLALWLSGSLALWLSVSLALRLSVSVSGSLALALWLSTSFLYSPRFPLPYCSCLLGPEENQKVAGGRVPVSSLELADNEGIITQK